MRIFTAAAAIGLAVPAAAQMDHGAMPGMAMPSKPAVKQTPVSKAAPMPVVPIVGPTVVCPQAGHDMSAREPAMVMEAQSERVDAPTPDADPHAEHAIQAAEAEEEIGITPAPAPATDHAADAIFDPKMMAEARNALRQEHGGLSNSMILFNLAEYQARKGADGYRWEGQGWYGGDINRLVFKVEGEGSFGGATEQAEFELLYGRAISPYFNLEAGVRYDAKPGPSRGYAVFGIEGIAPYWFDVDARLFLSDKGDLLARFEGSYDERITQKLILQPRAELNFAAQDVPENDVGSGLSELELGLRLRYEIKREFAPYVGVEWVKKFGDTARFSRIAAEDADVVNFVGGIRFWF